MNQRLQQFLNAENISQTQLADTLGVARASISHIISGRNKPGFDFIGNFARQYPTVSLDWLITGKGRMYKGDSNSIPVHAAPVRQEAAQSVETERQDELFDSLFDNAATIYQTTKATTVQSPVVKTVSESPVQLPQNSPTVQSRSISRIIVLYDDGSFKELK